MLIYNAQVCNYFIRLIYYISFSTSCQSFYTGFSHNIFYKFPKTGCAPAGFSVWLFPGKSLKGGSAGSWCAADQRTEASAAYQAADEWSLSRVFIRKRSESPRYPVRREAAHLEPAPERRDLSGKSHTEKPAGARPSLLSTAI